MKFGFSLAIAVLFTAMFSDAAGAAVTMTPIPMGVEALSGDGTKVFNATGTVLSRWTADQGVVTLGTLPLNSGSEVTGVSDDGSVVVGRFDPTSDTRGFFPFVWSASAGLKLYDPSEFASATNGFRPCVSGDGTAAFFGRYRLTPTGAVADGTFPSISLSQTGNVRGVFTGSSVSAMKYVSGVLNSVTVPGPASNVGVYGVSADGSLCVGSNTDSIFYWDAANNVTTSPREFTFSMWDASADARVVVGDDGFSPDKAIIAFDGDQMLIRDYLTSLGVPLASQPAVMPLARGISNDGQTFIVGTNASGTLITVPEPATISLLALAGVAVTRRRSATR